ncbi:cGMP-specific 3',5'-cyclic phosphodiesterase-like isoform X3 [Hippopotamus amphibius kiboko]|nr:cGMP-specific 3',5'-cyclic phosphodiesterase-like isoform X3 [Hippopotamus amphibius kiboko]
MEWAGPGSARPQQQWDQESVEAWLDDHWDFTFSYFVRKGTREMVNAWFAERVHTIPVCKEGVRGHTEACSCPSQQSPRAESSVPGTPTRKISASEFDRPLRPIVVKDSEGTVSFLSDSEKKEQMPLTPPRFDNDEGDQCSRLLELVKDISSHLDVTALCHKIFLHIHGLISTDRYSLFLVCEDSSNDKFLISRLFDVAEGSTLEEASNNCIRLEWNKGIVGHVAALEWLYKCSVQKLVVVISNIESGEVLERWQFDIECDKTAKDDSAPREKSQKAIQDEIRSVIRQITATVTFLPLLEVP